jgi:hypothetical protein
VELYFANPVTFNTVYISFDTNLDVLVSKGAAPECVRDYHLLWKAAGDWRDLLSIKGNYQRRRTHQVERISAKALRLVVEATNGDPSARVYEIRLYLED